MSIIMARRILVLTYAVCGAFIGACMVQMKQTEREIEETRKRFEEIKKFYNI